MIKIENLTKTFRTTEVETLALNKVSLRNLWQLWDLPVVESLPY